MHALLLWSVNRDALSFGQPMRVAAKYPHVQSCRFKNSTCDGQCEGRALGPMEPAEKSPSSSKASGEMGDGTGALSLGQRRGS